MGESTYLVAGCKPWNRKVFEDVISRYSGEWRFIGTREELTVEHLETVQPRYVFFIHWSWIVPAEIFERYECVVFHMSDVPFGRGGSPLQNLIVRGHRKTKLTALRMVGDLDAGPVYSKEDLCLEGNAEEILIRATHLAAHMMKAIVAGSCRPKEQEGAVVAFRRRRPHESEIPSLESIGALHDHIRMLDAHGYPRAFLTHRGFRYEFRRAAFYDGRIEADVIITRVEDEEGKDRESTDRECPS